MLPIAVVGRVAPTDAALGTLSRAPDRDGRLLVFAGDELVGIMSPSNLPRAIEHARLQSPGGPDVSGSPPPRPRTPDAAGRSPVG